MLYGHFMFAAYSFLLDKIPFCEKNLDKKSGGGDEFFRDDGRCILYLGVHEKKYFKFHYQYYH